MPRLIVIDGPAGAGKSTVARRLAHHFGVPLLDTGAIYRALALTAERAGVGWDAPAELAALAAALPIRFVAVPTDAPQRVELAGEDVTAAIRSEAIAAGASIVSAHPPVRDALLELQRALARDPQGCVAEGRDMGTVVFPDAPHKFFLTASLAARAQRRHAELVRRGVEPLPPLAEVRAELARRDARDSGRDVAPLAKADDALEVDSSGLDVDGVVARMLAAIAARGG